MGTVGARGPRQVASLVFGRRLSSHTAAGAWRLIWTLAIPSSTISKLSRVMLSGMSRGFAGRAIGKFRPNSDLMTEFQTETLPGTDLSSCRRTAERSRTRLARVDERGRDKVGNAA